jgi:Plant transposon protein
MHVQLRGNHKGKSKKPCNRMKIVCDDSLYIWHVMFGTPGSKNDINILHSSTLFNALQQDSDWSFATLSAGNRMPLTWYYYLVDGIYPSLSIFRPNIFQSAQL